MEVFSSLAMVLGLAAVGGVIVRLFKLPALLGYVAAGMVLTFAGGLHNTEIKVVVEVMGQLGVTLLLFLAGMELPISELKKTGRVSLVTGLLQIAITASLGFGIARLIGFGLLEAIYLGVGLTFGSTILVIKLLSEKRDLQSLYGKITVGCLLVQDFVAIGLLMILSGAANGIDWQNMGLIIVKGIVLVVVALWLSSHVVSRVLDFLGTSTELLFISSIGWCLAVAAFVSSPWVGFSVEIGGFLAGLSLAGALEQGQIISRVRPLRDFFLTWFFVALGANVDWGSMVSVWIWVIVLSASVIFINPVIVMVILGRLGYKKRVAFMTSLAVTQVSEFSLILVTRAVSAGEVGQELLSLLTGLAVVTMSISTFIILHADKIYELFGYRVAGLFERKDSLEITEDQKFSGHVILFGHNRIGKVLRPVLEKLASKLVIVDFNPMVVEKIKTSGQVEAVYGDMSDHELYERINLSTAAMIISTVPDFSDNLQMLDELPKEANKPIVISTAVDSMDAKLLYKRGADYVLVPHSVGGELLTHVFGHHGLDRNYIKNYGQAHKERL